MGDMTFWLVVTKFQYWILPNHNYITNTMHNNVLFLATFRHSKVAGSAAERRDGDGGCVGGRGGYGGGGHPVEGKPCLPR